MMKLENALAFAAKVREYNKLTEIDPKLMGQIVKGAEESDQPLTMLNEQGAAEVEEWIKQHG